MISATTRREKYNQSDRVLYVALELSNRTWKLGMTVGFGQKARERNVPAGDLVRFSEEIRQAKKRFGLPKAALVYSCYEAGRDGFWLHRFLEAEGLENVVVDPSSIEVSRRKRRAKTDHLDLYGLLKVLMRYRLGEPKELSVVRVPSVEAEDNRHLHRELQQLKKERTQHINRIKALLVGVGVRLHLRRRGVLAELEQARLWDGARLPPALHCRLVREQERLELVHRQILELEAERQESLRECRSEEVEKVRRLMTLRGIGANGAWLLGMELFVWRQFQNRRQVGSIAGLTPTPHESGEMKREQGISKAGNRYIRAMMVELAWGWLRFQAESQLSQWYQERFGRGGPRLRRIGIVALARKLLVALWRWVEASELPTGAKLRPA